MPERCLGKDRCLVILFKQKTAYEITYGDWSSDVCSSDLATPREQIENAAPKGEHYLLEVDHPLVLPVGKKVRILMTAIDVIHSGWVPAFGVKTDSIPGFINESLATINEPGTYQEWMTSFAVM